MSKTSIGSFFQGLTTPLASIFGSGFLIIISVLGGTVGEYAVLAMAAICALAYAVGSVIRYNIKTAEPIIETGQASRLTVNFERIADLALVPAYVISVTLYLRILSSYALGYFKIDTDFHEQILTTCVIGLILAVALTKGLKVLEGLEKIALMITLVIIAVLIIAFGFYDLSVISTGNMQLPTFPKKDLWHIATVLGGTLIVVQGFETTRYLSAEFDTETRIRACRNSQIISTAVYLLFVGLATPLMHFLPTGVSDNALMALAGIVAVWLPVPLVLAAIFSQFSAATADAIGGSGNLSELTNKRIKENLTYILICGFAILLCWTADTLQILALASRAFAFYYLLQCLVAISVADTHREKLWFGAIGIILTFITIFAVPVG